MVLRKKSFWANLTVLMSIFTLFPLTSLGPGGPLPAEDSSQGGVVIIEKHRQTGYANFIHPREGAEFAIQEGAGIQATAAGVLAYLEYFAGDLGLRDPGTELVETLAVFNQPDSRSTTRFQQVYHGLPVLAGELIVNLGDHGQLLSINGEVSPELTLSTEPAISASQAYSSARTLVGKAYQIPPESIVFTEAELWIYDERLLKPSIRPVELVWRFSAQTTGGDPFDLLILVSAQSGQVVMHFNQVDTFWSRRAVVALSGPIGSPVQGDIGSTPEARGLDPMHQTSQEPQISAEHTAGRESITSRPTAYLGTMNPDGKLLTGRGGLALPPGGYRRTYTANNTIILPGSLLCDETAIICTAGGDLDADAAHAYAGDTFQFYYDQHGRESIDDAGMVIVSSVHYGNNYNNAFWSPADQQMVYGDANSFARADDVVAHELTHGVTEHESHLFYYYQSGAINESFSDMWGEFVDLTNNAGSDEPADRWLIGEDLVGMSPLRSMQNPPLFLDPDRMTSSLYYTGPLDNGGVHINSGVNNKAVSLMVDGGVFNGRTVNALGIDKVAAIYYEVQTHLLTSGSDYFDLYLSLFQGCQNLVGGPQGITQADCYEVRDATEAVEMAGTPYPAYNPEAAVCPPGSSPSLLFTDDFETGTSAWTSGSLNGDDSWYYGSGYATSGTHMLWGYDGYASSDSYAALQAGIPLPAFQSSFLFFKHAYAFESSNPSGGWLEYSTDGGSSWYDAGLLIDDGQAYDGSIGIGYGNPNPGHAAFTGESHGYVSTRLDLSSLAGETVRLRWRLSTGDLLSTWGWFIDDVQVHTCSVAQPGPPEPLLKLLRVPASLDRGSSSEQWFARIALSNAGEGGVAFSYVVWLHLPEDWELLWARQYSFSGDFANHTLGKDDAARNWITNPANCSLGGGEAAAGYKWRAWRGVLEHLPSTLAGRLENDVNLRGGLTIPAGEELGAYGDIRVIVGVYSDTNDDGEPDAYSCRAGADTTVTILP